MASLIRVDDSFEVPDTLPVVALRDLVFFPYMVLPLLIGRPRSVVSLDEAEQGDRLLLLVAQKDPDVEDPDPDMIYRVGTVVRVVQVTRLTDGTARVVMEGLGRARIQDFLPHLDRLRARIELFVEREAEDGTALDSSVEALARRVERLYEEYVRLNARLPDELLGTLTGTGDRVRMAHLMAGHLLIPAVEKQEILEGQGLNDLLTVLGEYVSREIEILRIEERIDRHVQRQIDSDRRELYLQEQLKAIQKELGSGEGESAELEIAVTAANLPPHARERAEREIGRLRRLSPVAPEAAVIRSYLDWIIGLPWNTRTEDNLDVAHAARILDEAHYGLSEIKERILDHIAVLSLVRDLQGPILCLVGPPGVGKTSLGRSIGTALGREFVRVSLGGVRDEAEIRGHRRTYVGALPGRVIQGMRRGRSRNPVFMLDEIDKLAVDFHGDPAAALLEVLDPEQNRSFTDHYLELEYDLSDVLFLATANTLAGIPEPLRDRMEVIRLPGYLETEKRIIGRRFLWPRQVSRHGLSEGQIVLPDDALDGIIQEYTREAGVRELERRVSRVARKVARKVASGDLSSTAPITIERSGLRELLGPPPYAPADRESRTDRAGIANGLAWTAAGGEVLDVEVAVVPGTGKIHLTGTLGSVMKESAFAAVTFARARAVRFGLPSDFYQEMDIHIHIPEGATPKDGPSAGVTIAAALISALTGTPTDPDVAMTGEITLRGRILPVGGIREKAVAARRGGMRAMIFPAANTADLELLPEEVQEQMEFIAVRTMDEVLKAALVRDSLPREARSVHQLLGEAAGPGMHISQ
jgi:ATP-dependent Lon protease